MSSVSQCHDAGLLIVLARPKQPAYLDEFHEWYNTEHGPLRMRLNFVKTGYRYRTTSQDDTTWAGIYDIERVSALADPRYTNLRKFRSAREREVMSNKIDILQRKICKMISSTGHSDGRAPVIMTESYLQRTGSVDESLAIDEVAQLAESPRLPGWRRSRCYQVLDGDLPPTGYVELLIVHEFDRLDDTVTSTHRHSHNDQRQRSEPAFEIRHCQIFDFYHEFRAQDYKQPPDPVMHPCSGSSRNLLSPPVHLAAMQKNDVDSLPAARFVPPLVS